MVVSAVASGGTAVITVKLTYAGDGDPVPDATVTVAGDDGADIVLTPVVLAPTGGGEFSGTVPFPRAGTWNLRITSVTPAAEVALTQTVDAGSPATVGAGRRPSPPLRDRPATTRPRGPRRRTRHHLHGPRRRTTTAARDVGPRRHRRGHRGSLGVVFVARGRRVGSID